MRLLLISNSTMPGEAYLDYPKHEIKKFLGDKPLNVLFIPYAAVTFSFDQYEQKVSERFNELGFGVQSIHNFSDPVKAIKEAEVIVTGGGNTWQLVRMMHDNNLMEAIRTKVVTGTPYVGWSAVQMLPARRCGQPMICQSLILKGLIPLALFLFR